MSAPVLAVRDLCVSYGRAQVVHDVSIKVISGALVTVIGSNGAGKTTLLNAIMGLLKARGHIGFRDAEIATVTLENRVQAGLCLVPERRELFADMPVEDNLLLGGFRRSRAERKQTLEEIFARLPRLKERRLQLAGPRHPSRRHQQGWRRGRDHHDAAPARSAAAGPHTRPQHL